MYKIAKSKQKHYKGATASYPLTEAINLNYIGGRLRARSVNLFEKGVVQRKKEVLSVLWVLT